MLLKREINNQGIRYFSINRKHNGINIQFDPDGDNHFFIHYLSDYSHGYDYNGDVMAYVTKGNTNGYVKNEDYYLDNYPRAQYDDYWLRNNDIRMFLIENDIDERKLFNDAKLDEKVIRFDRFIVGLNYEVKERKVFHPINEYIQYLIREVTENFTENPGLYNPVTYEQIIPDYYHIKEMWSENIKPNIYL